MELPSHFACLGLRMVYVMGYDPYALGGEHVLITLLISISRQWDFPRKGTFSLPRVDAKAHPVQHATKELAPKFPHEQCDARLHVAAAAGKPKIHVFFSRLLRSM